MAAAIPEAPSPALSVSDIVAQCAPAIAAGAAAHDRDGSFVSDSYAVLKQSGFFRAGVPAEFGGLGANLRELSFAHHDLARACGSTSLAAAMHSHTVATTAARYRRGAPVEGTLKRVVNDGIILISTGGNDLLGPSAKARKADGGWVVSGRKVFASQAPEGSVMATWAITEEEEPQILALSIPMSAEGVEMVPTWDSHGMRGTGSNDVLLNDVFIPDAAAGARRPIGRFDPLIRLALTNGLTIITGVYLGLADAARRHASETVAKQGKSGDPMAQRLVGEAESEYAAARLVFEGLLARLGDDPDGTVEQMQAIFHAKRAVTTHGEAAINAARAAVGGQAFYRTSPLERIARDFQGIKLHPLTPEATLFYTGKAALGGDPELP